MPRFSFLTYSLSLIIIFLFSGLAFAEQAAVIKAKAAEHCVKSGKVLRSAKTKNICKKAGGSWEKKVTRKMPIDPYGKGKAMPVDPLGKDKAMPVDPYGKGKAMPIDPLGKDKAMPAGK